MPKVSVSWAGESRVTSDVCRSGWRRIFVFTSIGKRLNKAGYALLHIQAGGNENRITGSACSNGLHVWLNERKGEYRKDVLITSDHHNEYYNIYTYLQGEMIWVIMST